MCGRFSFFVPASAAENRFDANAVVPITPRYNIAPGEGLYSITNQSPEEIGKLQWGLLPHWVDDPEDSPRPINARAETIDSKPYFRDAFEERRCLVLADGFYEWTRGGRNKVPYRVTIGDGEPFAMAGVWETRGENGDAVSTVAIVTTEANSVVQGIHDRMPVILDRGAERRWLDAEDPEERAALLGPAAADRTTAFEVSTRVNDPTNDDPSVIAPVDSEQSGLGEFS